MQIYNALQTKKGAKVQHNRLGSITQPLQFLSKKDKDDETKESVTTAIANKDSV